MIIVYTGNGKGKTTASFGLALRAAGYQKAVLILQFVKQESWPEGARVAIRQFLPTITIKALGSGFVGILGDKLPKKTHRLSASKAVAQALKAINSKRYDIIVLDEILGALEGKLVTKVEVQKLVQAFEKKGQTALVLTGRHCPSWLITKADLVTEMTEIKHPFQKGIQAKQSIDY